MPREETNSGGLGSWVFRSCVFGPGAFSGTLWAEDRTPKTEDLFPPSRSFRARNSLTESVPAAILVLQRADDSIHWGQCGVFAPGSGFKAWGAARVVAVWVLDRRSSVLCPFWNSPKTSDR